MSEQSPKIGKKGELKKVAKKLTELRNTPISEKVFEIVEEFYQSNQKRKQVAKSRDREA